MYNPISCPQLWSAFSSTKAKAVIVLASLNLPSLVDCIHNFLHQKIEVINSDQNDGNQVINSEFILQLLLVIPFLFKIDKMMRIEPHRVLPLLFLMKGLTMVVYGTALYEEWFDGAWGHYISSVIGFPIFLISTAVDVYMKGHLLIEIRDKLSLELGFLNSAYLIIRFSFNPLFVFITQSIHAAIPTDYSELYLCIISLVVPVALFVPYRIILSLFDQIPNRVDDSTTPRDFIRLHLVTFHNSGLGVIIGSYAASSVVFSYFTQDLTRYSHAWLTTAITLIHVSIAALINCYKYRFQNWEHYLRWMFILSQGLLVVIVCTPTIKQLVSHDDSTWGNYSFYSNLAGGWAISTVMLMVLEYIQEATQPPDRGCVFGMLGVLITSLTCGHVAITFLLRSSLEAAAITRLVVNIALLGVAAGLMVFFKPAIRFSKEDQEDTLLFEKKSSSLNL